MKRVLYLSVLLVLISFHLSKAQTGVEGLDYLLGEWVLDMSPEDESDENFAFMKIENTENGRIKGEFYREGVKIKNGRINSQTGVIHGALISGDNSGDYNSAFYLKDGILYGTTHAIGRDFLAVWTAIKRK